MDGLGARDESIKQGKDPGPPVPQDHQKRGPLPSSPMRALRIANPVVSETLGGKELLFRRKPTSVGRVIGHEEPKNQSHKTGANTVNDLGT